MDLSSGRTLAELLRNLGAKLSQGANFISHTPSLSKIKALEDDVHVALAILRRHINPLESPLYRLPPDLFPEIASHLASETDLVNATHVSHHLRSTLLSYSRLWAHLDFEHEMRACAFFERSRQTPLHVNMTRDTSRMVASLADLRQQSKRVATLKLGHWTIEKSFLSEPLPSLRKLEITYRYDGDDDGLDEEWDIDWAPVWGPKENTTSWSFPTLTSLIIYNLHPIPFHTPRLTCFKFCDEEDVVDTDTIVDFFSNCPLLEHINIFYAHEYQGERDLVSLPCLRTYTENTLNEVCPLTVLNTLSLPPSCSVTLGSRTGCGPITEADDTFPHFENPDYLTEITRIKLKTTDGINGREKAGTLELINAKGTRVCSERMDLKRDEHKPLENQVHNEAHLGFLRSLNCRSVGTLCIDGYAWQKKVAVEFLKEALGLGNVGTLVLSHNAVGPCLSVLDENPGASGHSRWFSLIHTLIVCPGADTSPSYLHDLVLRRILRIAQRKKVAGLPFRFTSLFLGSGQRSEWGETLEELKTCVGKLEVVTGDDCLDWDVDKYFLDGLDYLQKDRDVQWD